MKNYTSNSFAGGLITDLNESSTPTQVLTDALNATLLTNNGNEIALQNDMGNAPIGTSALPEGYVPVGMKEFGGIIYVASFNPETKKGQIGSFPSPQQLYLDEDNDSAFDVINLNKFLEEREGLLYINQEFINKPIFKDKIFHNGDRFLIIGNLSDNVIKAIYDGVLNIKLGVLNEGTINFIDNKDLTLFKHESGDGVIIESFICPNSEEESVEEILKSNRCQILNSASSGYLVLSIEYNTIDSFIVTREYSESNGKYQVKFTGNISLNPEVNLPEGSKRIVDLKSFTISEGLSCELTANEDNKVEYRLAPATPYGILERLTKEGSIDFKLFSEQRDLISNWSQFVGESDLIISWSYDFYDINNPVIEEMGFKFIDINNVNLDEPLSSDIHYKHRLERDVYLGDFEDSISLSLVPKGSIYLCVIYRKLKDKEAEDIGCRFVYVSDLFNNCTAKDLENFSDENRPEITIGVRPKVVAEDDGLIEGNVEEKIRKYKDGEDIPDYSDFEEKDSLGIKISENTSDYYIYEYYTKGSYNNIVQIEPEIIKYSSNNLVVNSTNLIGTINLPKSDFIKEVSSKTDDSEVVVENLNPDSIVNPTIDNESNSVKFTTSTTRNLYSKTNKVSKVNVSGYRLEPVYDPTREDANEVIYKKKSSDGCIYCLGAAVGKSAHLQYNVKYNRKVSSIPKGSLYEGTTLEQGGTKTALTLAASRFQDPGVTFLTGVYGVDGKMGLEISNTNLDIFDRYNWSVGSFSNNFSKQNRDSLNNMFPNKEIEINLRTETNLSAEIQNNDEADDYIFPVMRDTQGNYILLNAPTKRTGTLTDAIDFMTYLFSQLLIAQYTEYTDNYVVPDNIKYNTSGNTKATCTIKPKTLDADIISYGEGGIETLLENIANKAELQELGLKNFLPTIKFETEPLEYSFNFGDNLSIPIDVFNNVSSGSQTLDMKEEDKKRLFLGKVVEQDTENKIFVIEKDLSGNCVRIKDNILLTDDSTNIVKKDTGEVNNYIFAPTGKFEEHIIEETQNTYKIHPKCLSLCTELSKYFVTRASLGLTIDKGARNSILLKADRPKDVNMSFTYEKVVPGPTLAKFPYFDYISVYNP